MPWLEIIAVVSVFVAILYAIAYTVDGCREIRKIIEVARSDIWERGKIRGKIDEPSRASSSGRI
jgi:hypothetical protein